ncbi:hypothetical protein DLAC_05674 [Tieghemostelium lacteum]|uniref:Uncharacterized protein n=1 Tax=Tieghemostelium lacteum TaxID=361077 RepID=A0A151ZGH1_TIELA|nr:hypothetical protein DLAC_05674 [Tieghemostelium lacteum]|eukprot:KYQ93063.1 hypothetical protein DLAC_05674 [Tieghemostelium lacteum]
MNKNKKKLNLEIPIGNSINGNISYPKQIEYLKLLSKNQLVTLKQLCFITLSKIFYDQLCLMESSKKSPSTASPKITSTQTTPTSPTQHHTNTIVPISGMETLSISNHSTSSTSTTHCNISNTSTLSASSSSSVGIHGISSLPLEIKEELLHFMLEHRLLHISKLYHSFDFLSIVDSRIKSLDFSMVKSKISTNDPTRELLKICTNLQNIDLSNCYEANDSILKIIISNLSNQPHSNSNSNPSTPTGIPSSSSTFNLPPIEETTHHNSNTTSSSSSSSSSLRKSFLNKILKKRKSQSGTNNSNSTPNSPQPTHNEISVITSTLSPNTVSNNAQLLPTSPNISQSNNSLLSASTSTSSFEEQSINDMESLSSSTTSDSLHSVLDSSQQMGSGLLFLSLKQCTTFTDSIIRRLLKLSPNLTYLDLTGCSIHQKTLQLITGNCLKLKTLSLSTIPLPMSPSIVNSFHNILNLTSLDLSYLTNLTDAVMSSLLSSPTSISSSSVISSIQNPVNAVQSLKIPTSPLQSPRKAPSIQSLFQISSSYSLNSGTSLKTFMDLSNSSLTFPSTGTNSTTSSNSGSATILFPTSLLSLNLSQSDIEDESLLLISKKCPLLQEIDLSFCSKISNQGLSDLASGLSNLLSFSARVVKASTGISEVVMKNKYIQKLDIRFTKIEEAQLKEIGQHLTFLKILRVDGTPITDNVIRSICTQNRSLEIIGLSQCKNITYEIIMILADLSKCLRKLYISHSRLGLSTNTNSSQSHNISNTNVLQYLEKMFSSDGCTQLSCLDIAFTPLVNDQILSVLCKSRVAESLEALFIGGGFHNLSNYSVAQLALSCPRIRVFSCISSFNILDESICECIRKWLLLEALELTDCTSLTTVSPMYLVQSDECLHIHFHLRFVFFSSSLEFKDHSALSKIEGKTSIEIFEMRQKITLEDILEQNWLNL